MRMERTRAAIAAYDEFDAALDFEGMDQKAVLAGFAKLDALGEAVGVAFGLDTADVNSMDTCKCYVRPGPKVPAVGAELSFVRRAVERSFRISSGKDVGNA